MKNWIWPEPPPIPAPTSLKIGIAKEKFVGVLCTVTEMFAVVVADPACPFNAITKLPTARLAAATRVIGAPPAGTERGNVVLVVRPAGSVPRVTLGVPEPPDAFTVTVIVLLGTMSSGLGVTEIESIPGPLPPPTDPGCDEPPPQEMMKLQRHMIATRTTNLTP